MTPADLLLHWVSSFPELRVARVRAAAERLHEPPARIDPADPRSLVYRHRLWRLAGNLLRLGHVEQAPLERWRTVPPTVVWCSDEQGYLCGARSKDVRDRFGHARGVSVAPPASQYNAPEVWSVSGDCAAVAEAAASAGVHITPERGADLLAALPPLSDQLSAAPTDGLPDSVERLDVEAKRRADRWKPFASGSADTVGLYRTRRSPRHYYFRQAVDAPVVRLDTPERRVGAVWQIAGARRSLQYCRSGRVLRMPAVGFGLPLLVDRGLILASGRLPTWADGGWEYHDVGLNRADDAARILGLRIEVSP
jgi:hypothetical protein